MKRLLIRVENSSNSPLSIQIRPATRSCDVAASLKLSGYVLVPASADDLAKAIFQELSAPDSDLYERVADGAELIALPAMDAVRMLFEHIQ